MPSIDKKSRNTEVERGSSKEQVAANERGNSTQEDTVHPK
jgi:hypothetical protein